MHYVYIICGSLKFTKGVNPEFLKFGESRFPRQRVPQLQREIEKQCRRSGLVPSAIGFDLSKSMFACVDSEKHARRLENLLLQATKQYKHKILSGREYRENIPANMFIAMKIAKECGLELQFFSHIYDVSILHPWLAPVAQKPSRIVDHSKQQVIFLGCLNQLLKLADVIYDHKEWFTIVITPTSRDLIHELSWGGAFDIQNNQNITEGILLSSELGDAPLVDGSTAVMKLSSGAKWYLSTQKHAKIVYHTLLQALALLKAHRATQNVQQ